MKKMPTVSTPTFYFLSQLRNDSLKYYTHLHEKYGDIFCKHYYGAAHYYLKNPKHIEHVLSKNQDNYRKHPKFVEAFEPYMGTDNLLTINNMTQWRRDRNLAQTAFDFNIYADEYAKIIAQVCTNMLDYWDKQFISHNSNLVPIGKELNKLTVEITKKTVFNDLDVDTDELAQALPSVITIVTKKMLAPTQLMYKLPTKTKRDYLNTVELVNQIASNAVKSRLRSGKNYDDLLGTYLSALQVTDCNSPNYNLVLHDAIVMFVGGYLNQSSIAHRALVTLAQNPDMEQKIADEVASICGDRPLSYADYLKLVYTKAFLLEVMRFHPSGIYFMRESIGPDEIDGYPIPAGSAFLTNVYLAHHHPDYWSEPEKFIPERFLHNPLGQEHPYAYLPYGMGKRACTARNLTLLGMCATIVSVVQRYRLKIPQGVEVKNIYTSYMSIRPNVNEMLVQKK